MFEIDKRQLKTTENKYPPVKPGDIYFKLKIRSEPFWETTPYSGHPEALSERFDP